MSEAELNRLVKELHSNPRKLSNYISSVFVDIDEKTHDEVMDELKDSPLDIRLFIILSMKRKRIMKELKHG